MYGFGAQRPPARRPPTRSRAPPCTRAATRWAGRRSTRTRRGRGGGRRPGPTLRPSPRPGRAQARPLASATMTTSRPARHRRGSGVDARARCRASRRRSARRGGGQVGPGTRALLDARRDAVQHLSVGNRIGARPGPLRPCRSRGAGPGVDDHQTGGVGRQFGQGQGPVDHLVGQGGGHVVAVAARPGRRRRPSRRRSSRGRSCGSAASQASSSRSAGHSFWRQPQGGQRFGHPLELPLGRAAATLMSTRLERTPMRRLARAPLRSSPLQSRQPVRARR